MIIMKLFVHVTDINISALDVFNFSYLTLLCINFIHDFIRICLLVMGFSRARNNF